MEEAKESEHLFCKFKSFCEINEQFLIAFKLTEGNSALNRNEKNELHLHYIASNIIIVPLYFQDVVAHFSEFLGRILSISIASNSFNNEHHKKNCVLLGKIVQIRPDLQWYATKYFEKNPSPFTHDDKVVTKRIKMQSVVEISDLHIVESCYSLLKSNLPLYEKKWDWSDFSDRFLNHKDTKVLWIACHCLALVTHMSENQLKMFFATKLDRETCDKLSCLYDIKSTLVETSRIQIDQTPCISINRETTTEVVQITGIDIPKVSSIANPQKKLVLVDTTSNNLRKIALCLSSNKPICLQGVVGSGKTTLIEYLAEKTGRKLGEDFIKVQLGDQTDSKMLLGTYRCTDIPGEFVWQPGVLTQAVIKGYWLLLEDIDLASMDIASVLSSLLENGNLTVPGYRDSVAIAPGFQLFVTQRLITSITGHHKKQSNAISILDKHLSQVNIDPLTFKNLQDILITQYPQFSTIADRMINVFQIFSQSSKTSRLISTRDFFKWCARASKDFDIKSQASALKVLQDAIDVFCCSISNTEDALNFAKEFSTHLGIINQKAEYFFKLYKPSIKLTAESLGVGRGIMTRTNENLSFRQKYFFTRPSAVLLERIMCCVEFKEPVLLVGETGTGKTSTVQYLANAIGQKLVVINMNQQSDSADLLGGFKPIDLKFIVAPIREQFEEIFCSYFKVEPNRTFLSHIARSYNEQKYNDLVAMMMRSYEAAMARLTKPDAPKKELLPKWQALGEKLQKLNIQLKQKNALAFAFIEGSLAKAVEKGYWVLLDEINLANAETLECLSGLLEGSTGSLCLLERGDKEVIKRHPNFTLFACMNPSTDVGKKDLPLGLRNRFTEFYVEELTEKNDLLILVGSYLEALSLKNAELEKIVDFYLKVQKETEKSLTDGLGHKPHFSLRSLCRALMVTARNPCGMVKKSLYESFCLSFLTQLDANSYQLVEKMIGKYLIGDEKSVRAVIKQPIPPPRTNPDGFLQFEGYWVRKGTLDCSTPEDYILTESVRKNLKDLVRIVSIGSLPVLLQGDTSVGKTSLITYLAKSSGNKCVRINNHEHTDLQEYIGSYVANSEGKLVFREGILVEAMRKGHWIILDELNLAPTDVLEALNRVLDDNRELFISETQEIVKADPNFMLFATQNPPGSYGGRKMLSRAFRNRFVELHFNEIPPNELEFILHKRCQMPMSYAKKVINVMTDLQMRRRGSAAFAGKKGFITLRDLFRWGERYRLAQNSKKLYDWDQHLADEGYLVLAGRVRRSEEKKEIISVLQKHLKRDVNPDNLFTLSDKTSIVTKDILTKIYKNRDKFPNIVWTFNMRQLAVLVAKAFQFKEPVLLVGETGGGKTTVCQLIADLNNQNLLSVNCHMHTESSDFIGGLRPVRDHANDDVNKLFEWVDGPLIHAMVKGHVFLADEISLADDSVLERLNSLLEPERTLLLVEKGTDINNTSSSELIVADSNFYFIGTMNPGGDFGKKELSPALRNRFTEIWCEACTNRNDLIEIIEQNIKKEICFCNQEDGSSGIGNSIMEFIEWFKKKEIGKKCTVSIRDILTWVNFINVCAEKIGVYEAYLHGVHLTFLDGLGSGATSSESSNALRKFKQECEKFIHKQIALLSQSQLPVPAKPLEIEADDNFFGIKPFYIEVGSESPTDDSFAFTAPTTTFNTLRLLRGMQLNKAILLEGSPGVGKTSLVTSLAKFARHKIFRINLSDQTDISDLFGADLPVEGGVGGQFSWRDGPLLQALKQGYWILLDELNLASQSVLEGLNACLDHRGEIFIPELAKTFRVKSGTRFFACQNPLKQGGSRRGLPQSFLNRFVQVYVTSLTDEDLGIILKSQFANLPQDLLDKMIKFNSQVCEKLSNHSFGNKGAPWEFNLRDLTRWCEAMIYHYNANKEKDYQPENLVHLVYGDRMRTLNDKLEINRIFRQVFENEISGDSPIFYVNSDRVFFGDVSLERSRNGVDRDAVDLEKNCLILRSQMNVLRSLAYGVNLNWMCLLVGNSACGKSSVVRTLANVIGKTLRTLPVTSAMDTTDILGGFEQTDYVRHFEEIAKETEQLVLRNVRFQLVKGRSCTKLLRLWKRYSNVEDDDAFRTQSEEIDLFLTKLNKLETIWKNLEEEVDENSLDVLRNKSIKIREAVEKERCLNAGGKFEWVDSILVKCLQDGAWLLVDNVNLCSAAVLDRLNALLEPKGILTINERGVDSQGRMMEIVPHPNFRLFLTMDPKNGEISRAMRNRGLEIYILDDREKKHRNNFDIKSLISNEGLENKNHIDTILNLHDFISDLILGEKPNTNELLHASNLISQQIQYGIDDFEAFYNTIMEVYYKRRSSVMFNCNDFDNVIRTEINKILDRNDNSLFQNQITLNTNNLHICSEIEKIKQLLTAKNVKYFLVYYYTTSSNDELKTRFNYSLLLNDKNDISEILFKFVTEFPMEFHQFPIDCGWIPDINHTRKDKYICNKLNLGLFLTVDLKEELNQNESSMLKYMKQRLENSVQDCFNDVLIDEFLNLIKEYDEFLIEKVKSFNIDIDDSDVIKILQLTTWRFFFYKCAMTNIEKTSRRDRYFIVINFRVHYRWFLKYSINSLTKILNQQLPKKLQRIINIINESLEKEFTQLHKVSRNFQKFNNNPPPRTNFEDIEFETNFQNALKIIDSNDQQLRDELIKLKLSESKDINKLNALLEVKTEITLSNYELALKPFIEYFVRLELKKMVVCRGDFNHPNLPIDLITSIRLYQQDSRFIHKMTKNYFLYLSNFTPNLNYYLCLLLIGNGDGSVTKFGNFNELSKQHRVLNLTLWRNYQQMFKIDYDNSYIEQRFVIDSFQSFIEVLSKSLNISNGNLIENFIDKLSDNDDLTKSFIYHLKNCMDFYNLTKNSVDIHQIHKMHMELCYLKAILNSRLPSIDPSTKKALKKKYNKESVDKFTQMQESFIEINKIYTDNDKISHPYYQHIISMIGSLKKKSEKLDSYVAVRPNDILYDEVVQNVKHAFSTIFSNYQIDKIFNDLDKVMNGLINFDDCKKVLKRNEMIIASLENLVTDWAKYSPAYPDIIEPLLSNGCEFIYAFKSDLELLKKQLMEKELKKFGIDLERDIVGLVKIPNVDGQKKNYEEVIDGYSNRKFLDFVKSDPKINRREEIRLLKCAVQESFNSFVLEPSSSQFLQFSNFIKAFVDLWNEQEKNREIAEKEADALYKIRTKCDDKPEDEQIEDELKELFPNYHDEDFADLNNKNLTDDPQPNIDNKKIDLISTEDIKFIVDLHLTLVQNFTKSEWLNPEHNKKIICNFIEPLMEKYKLFKQICDKIQPSLDYKIDRELFESVKILITFVENYGDLNKLVEQSSPIRMIKKSNFYKDSNVEEVKSSFHILEELRLKVKELLEEWPDHPTLKTIMVVVERVYNFDITSPLSRFLTAFEILLSKCHEWEEVAHSGVSLSQFSQNITHQIISWRKIELKVWKDLLNTTMIKMNSSIYKWWLYLYNIMEQFIEEEKNFTDIELIEALQNFITKSNLAEFQNRLNLLYAFHCHAIYLKKTNKTKRFIYILWNVYNYFQQFSGNVEIKIKHFRTPIEKKLKDFVKIVKWKDVNYWAIKETVDKTHKTLHKYVREFQDVLNQPATECLVNIDNSTNIENVGIWDRPQRNLVKTYHYTLDPSTYVAKETTKKKLGSPSSKHHHKLSTKIDSYFIEIRKLCKESITSMKYPKMIQTLDNLVTQIIETSSHLQNLQVDTTLPKPKQKSLAKSILNQKHRALADLFKVLTKIGLSFRTGLIEKELKIAAEEFLVKPIDFTANFNHINYNRKDEKILTIWDSCEMYYLKSLMRADVLETALKMPAKDLGQQNAERCRGFSSHLLMLAQNQKTQLIESGLFFYYLRHYTTQMTRVYEGKHFLHRQTIDKIQLLLKNIKIVLIQTQIILNTCPEEDFRSETLEIFTLKPESTFLQFKYDQLWNKIANLLNETLNLVLKLRNELEKCKGEIPNTEFNIVQLKYIPVGDNIGEKLDQIKANVEDLKAMFEDAKITESFDWLIKEFELLKSSLDYSEDSASDINKMEGIIEDLSEEISSVIRSVYEKYSAATSSIEDSEETEIEDNHLKVLIIENLQTDYDKLQIEKILNLCHKIAEEFFTVSPKYLSEFKTPICFILPLLEQIILYHQYFLTQQVSAYRIICKMSSILLNIFIELTSKGFCIPPELTDDDDEEGVSKPSDGIGLGEGRGERDVSDRIESEDQLDDAQPAGNEKEQNEDPDCKEEDKGIEMSEDFDSKLQDIKEKDDEEEEKSDDDDEGEEQMGETDDKADRKEKETYGSDEEDVNNGDDKGEGGEKQGDEEIGAKEKESKSDDKVDKNSEREKEDNKKDINEMEDKEFDDEQIDPYHGNQPELPEPEAMDLPDDLQLDEGDENEDKEDETEDNPFDVDTMKEDNSFEKEDKLEDEEDNSQNDDKNFSSDDEEITKTENNEEEGNGKENNEIKDPTENNAEEEQIEDRESSAIDQTHTNEDNVEAMDINQSTASDKVRSNQAQNQKSDQPIDNLCQEDKPDKEGVGQSQMEESTSGHQAQTSSAQELKSSKRNNEEMKKQQKPGESDEQRSLGDVNEPVKKKLKTIDDGNTNEEGFEDDKDRNEEAEMYKHIKEVEKSTTQILDVATKEQAESQKFELNQEEESMDDLILEDDDEIEDVKEINKDKPEKVESEKKKTEVKQHRDGKVLEEINDVEVDGDVIETITVQRGNDTTYHTLYEEMKNMSTVCLTQEELSSLRIDVENQLSTWTDEISDAEADRAWQKISSMMSSLAQDLCEQLRLVLEPTQLSRLKGDYRTGRRINMRKVIPYIASQFRKDKIWLRRTKPSKREYQIVLAIDDSSSMNDNHSKELAFESIALISKALSLLESGQLCVVSFGEETKILHKLTEQFSDRSGTKLLKKFKFDQNKTRVGKLVDFVVEMFTQTSIQSSALNAKLLVIVSDGRGVFSEGELLVRQAVRRAKLADIFMVFVIIDNPENKNSILDIRMPVFKDGKLMGIQNYMDVFPFSFYIILRDINSLPNVLSDALRQWFEVVSNLDKL